MTWFNHGPRGSRLNRERQIGINRWIGGKKRRKAADRAFLLEGLERRELLAFAQDYEAKLGRLGTRLGPLWEEVLYRLARQARVLSEDPAGLARTGSLIPLLP